MIALWPNIVFALLALMILWLPLPYGSATPGGLLATRLTVVVAAALAVAFKDSRPVPAGARTSVAVLVGLAALGLLQILPLPPGLIRLVSPGHFELGGRLLSSGWAQLSLAPSATLSAVVTLICLGIGVWTVSVSTDRKLRRWLALAIMVAGSAQVVWGLRGWLSGSTPRLHGTFVNSDHLAVYLEISLCVCFAACVWAFRWARGEPSLERRLMVVAGPVCAWFVVFSGLLLTGSRAGIAAAFCGLIVQSLLLPRVLRFRRAFVVALLPVTAGLLALAFVGVQRGLGRWLQTSWHEVGWSQRLEVWKASVSLIERFPLTGSGLGSFAQAFPLVQPRELVEGRWTHAHNDPLELMVTGGPLAGLALVVGVAAISVALWRLVGHGNRTEDRVAGLAGIGALVSVALHELVDFGLTLPANGFTVALLLGAATGARLRRSITQRR